MDDLGARYCKGCGYDLAGIGAGKCPECARGFDPGDARTYDTRSRGSRRSRWARRGFVLGALVVLLAAFFPRGYAEARLKFRRPGGTSAGAVRVRPMAPDWVRRLTGLDYPGWTRHAAGLKPSARAAEFTVCRHGFTLGGLTTYGLVTAKNDPFSLGQIKVNGVRAIAANAEAILDGALRPSARGGAMSLEGDSVGVGDK